MRYTLVIIIALIVCCGCSLMRSDEPIIRDYVLVDLGGSNQTILGANGSVYVSDVTAYNFSNGRINFERNQDHSRSQAIQGLCVYGFVDVVEASIHEAKPGSALSEAIQANLRRAGHPVIQRLSCVDN